MHFQKWHAHSAFLVPSFLFLFTLFAFKKLRRKWRDTSELKQRLIDTWANLSQNVVIDKAVGQWRKRLRARVKLKKTLWIFAKLRSALFRATNSLPRKTRCFASLPSQLFRCKQSNKISFKKWKCADAVCLKSSKLVRACQNYRLAKLARFLSHSVVTNKDNRKEYPAGYRHKCTVENTVKSSLYV